MRRIVINLMVISSIFMFLLFIELYSVRNLIKPNQQLVKETTKEESALKVENDLTEFLASMFKRAVTVLSRCSTEEKSWNATLEFAAANKVNKILYCPVPETANSVFLQAVLRTNNLWTKEDSYANLYDIFKKNFLSLQNVTVSPSSSFKYRMIVVRHPFERILACYQSTLEDAKRDSYYDSFGREMMRLYRDTGLGKEEAEALLQKADIDRDREKVLGNIYTQPLGPTFSEFVEYIVDPSHSDDECWKPFYDSCKPCAVKYNYILRYENILDEGHGFFKHVNASAKSHLLADFITPGLENSSCSYYSQLNRNRIEKLINKYSEDFYLFDYTPLHHINCADEYINPESAPDADETDV